VKDLEHRLMTVLGGLLWLIALPSLPGATSRLPGHFFVDVSSADSRTASAGEESYLDLMKVGIALLFCRGQTHPHELAPYSL
jgi:hypothetical protein